MKRTAFFFCLLSTMLVIGCRDSLLMAPEPEGQTEFVAKAAPVGPPYQGTVSLDGEAAFTASQTGTTSHPWNVSGSAKYILDPSPILMGDYTTVRLSMSAALKPGDGTGVIQHCHGESEDIVVRPLPGKSSVLVKSYPSSSPIFGSPTGGVTLNVRFMVSTTGVSVDGMWLTLTPIRS